MKFSLLAGFILSLNSMALDCTHLYQQFEDKIRFDSSVVIHQCLPLENENYRAELTVQSYGNERTIECEFSWDGDQKINVLGCNQGFEWFKKEK
ncbi:hypothetical protein HBN50_04345 [Halobacteriovorax sp. GB3]|uniref:hypothetical protein n=1 Tax=Halobacteriovorax sp. GB3 TaxID=2719615 RepID=UPI00235FC8B8|nr:hypothetical protein [Halobacteriovorax sp. GB3]MDD0852312.1 hypothetical protein [Halobacteriovorax sp. GB3]